MRRFVFAIKILAQGRSGLWKPIANAVKSDSLGYGKFGVDMKCGKIRCSMYFVAIKK